MFTQSPESLTAIGSIVIILFFFFQTVVATFVQKGLIGTSGFHDLMLRRFKDIQQESTGYSDVCE